MSGYYDRVTARRVTLPHVSISLLEQRLFKLLHPFAAYETWKGSALLDACVPGWQNRIDIENLCVSDDKHCMLAQLFGGYLCGARKLGITDGASLGFDCRPQMDPVYRKAWAIQIQNRH